MTLTQINTSNLKYAVVAAAHRVIRAQEQLNGINVFPVADSDTGTNMALTLRSVAEDALECKADSVHELSDALANAALLSAHGSSGAILAQFFQGFAEGLHGQVVVNLEQFGEAAHHAANYAREAVAEPQEGTILTVMRAWAQYVQDNWRHTASFPALIRRSLKVAEESLKMTPEKLDVLAKAGVVDAGAQGFVYMLEGIVSFIKSGEVETFPSENSTADYAKAIVVDETASIAFQFCTQMLVTGRNIDGKEFRQQLHPFGDSIIVAGSDKRVHIHIHTNDPERVLQTVARYGQVVSCKKEDMRDQHARAHHNPALQTIGLITDSSCDLPADEFIRSKIHVVPCQVTFGDQTYTDKVTITDRDFYRLLATSPFHPKTSQPTPSDFRKVCLEVAANHKEALAIIVSGALSGTLQAAELAARTVKEQLNVCVIDSKSISAGLGLIVREAAEAIESEATLQEVRSRVEWAIRHVRLFAAIGTMDHLVRGGRISKFRGAIVNLLKMKPILTMDAEGKAQIVAKAWGASHSRRKLMRIVKREAQGKQKLRFIVAHSDALATANILAEQIQKSFGVENVPVVPISPALGSHVGPKAAAVVFLG
ncbi:MAG TPA: DegV family protein [Pyrinomonadaceae bacterium]|nr:DegV family protein [Pyrinomonadaceae bacterium]